MAPSFLPKRVLIVDDNVDAASLASELLTFYGHTTATAFGGEQGILMVLEFAPDVVLLDLGMPLMNGFEVALKLRQMAESSSTVLIAYTAWNDEATKRKASQCGFDLHLAKPADIDHLLLAIASVRLHSSGDIT